MSYAASHISDNPSLKSYVERMGFEKILKLHIDMIPSNLAWSILSCYDVGRRCLILNGQHVEITRDLVYEIFGFPIGDLEIDFAKKTIYKNLGCSGLMETFWKQFRMTDEVDEKDNRKMKISHSTKLKDFILSRTTPNDTFKLNFIILLVTTMICASKGGESNMKFLPAIEEHYDNIHMYDWCGLVLKSLDQNPPDLPHNCSKNQYCGPLTFLTLVYIRWLFQRTKRNEDVIEYCSTDLLRKVDAEHIKSKNFGNFRFFCEKDIRVVDKPLYESNDALLKEYGKEDTKVIESKQVREEESQDMDSESQEHNETQESSKEKGVMIPSSNSDENERLEKENLETSKEQVSIVPSEEALFSSVHEVELVQEGPAPSEVSSPQSGIMCAQGYKVNNVYAPILEAILKKHGDIVSTCVFTSAAVRTSLLEAVCDIVRRIETNDVTNIMSSIKEIGSQLHVAEAAQINVSWLQSHLEVIRKSHEAEKKATMLMELQTNAILVERAAGIDLKERHAKLIAAQNEFAEAVKCVEVLKLVGKKLNNDVLELKAEKELLAQTPVI